MTAFVVDTNVPIAANGRETHADFPCQSVCIERLESLVENGIVAVDDKGFILSEYGNYLQYSGQPGPGDAFFKHVFDNQHGFGRVQRVAVTPSDDSRKGYEELPENMFDRSDRKFLAVAVAAKAVVLNATDSDWGEHESLMDELGVEVMQLCPQHATK